MSSEQRTRTLLGPADPVRGSAAVTPRLSAQDLIARAGAGTERPGRRHARPTRRLVLAAAGAATMAAGTAAVLRPFGRTGVPGAGTVEPPAGAQPGPVLVPVAYQFATNPPAAGTYLRDLSARLADAPYEHHTGRYAYHAFRSWGAGLMTSADGRYSIAFNEDLRIWQAADGRGRQVTVEREPAFPDQQSRDYWTPHIRAGEIFPAGVGNPVVLELGPESALQPPGVDGLAGISPAELAGLLKVPDGTSTACSEVGKNLYWHYAVARPARALILRTLADLPGLLWRGKVTDRAGRTGVAVTVDDRRHDTRFLLVFDRATGQLLAMETQTVSEPVRLSAYTLFLDTDRTDNLG